MVSSRNISKISKTIHKILNKRGGLNTFLKDSCLNVHKLFIYGTLANQVRALKYVGLRQVCPSFLPSWSLERGLDLEALFPWAEWGRRETVWLYGSDHPGCSFRFCSGWWLPRGEEGRHQVMSTVLRNDPEAEELWHPATISVHLPFICEMCLLSQPQASFRWP